MVSLPWIPLLLRHFRAKRVIKEIKYFVLFSTLKKLMEQGKITAEYCQQANVAIAEKYGVSELSI